MSNPDFFSMRKVRDIIEDSVLHPLEHSHRTLYIEGPPGIGKTALCHAVYSKHRRYSNDNIKRPVYWVIDGDHNCKKDEVIKPVNVKGGVIAIAQPTSKGNWFSVDNIHVPGGFTRFIAYVAPEREPTEWGLPMPNATRTAITMMPLDEFIFEPDERIFMLVDEIDKANNMMQNVLARLAHEHRVHNVALTNGSVVIMAGNRTVDRAGGFTANSHIKGRRTRIPAGVDHKEWIEDIGIPFGLHSSVVSYIRTAPDMLNKFDPMAAVFPSPRAWTKVGEDLNRPKDADVERALIEGDIGRETANTFWGHLRIHRELRSPEVIVSNPDGAPIPSGNNSVAIMWAEITALARFADTRTAEPIFRYFNRLPQEYAFCGYKDVLLRDQSIVAKSKQGQQWMIKNATLLAATKSKA